MNGGAGIEGAVPVGGITMIDDSTRATLRTWTRSAAAQAKAYDPDNPASTAWAERPAGWIVRMQDGDGRAVAAGPSAGEALALARELGSGEGRQASPVTGAELDALDLPPWALGIAPDERHADPWWREVERPVYRAAFSPESRTSPSPAAGTGRRTATTSRWPLTRWVGRVSRSVTGEPVAESRKRRDERVVAWLECPPIE